MLGAGVDLELRDLLPREPVLREHPLDGDAEHLGRAPVELLAERAALEPARIPGVPVVPLLVELVARDLDLLRVHDDDEVTGVDMRRELRLALAAERVGDLRRQTAQGLPLGVDEIPLTRDLSWLGAVRLHKKRRTPARRRRIVANAHPSPRPLAPRSLVRGSVRRGARSMSGA